MADYAKHSSNTECSKLTAAAKQDVNMELGKGIAIYEVDEDQPCMECGDRCPGFKSHPWRNICKLCRCPRESHDVYHCEFIDVRDRLGWPKMNDEDLKESTLREGFTWVPSGLSRPQISEYMDQLPNHKVPRISAQGERYRDLQLIYQLPRQDLSDKYCQSLESPSEFADFHEFRRLRDQIAMGIAQTKEAIDASVCHNCKGEIDSKELIIVASKITDSLCWHPACFICSVCEELLVDLTYCHFQQKLFCERHFAELVRPRCFACDELIFSSEYTKAMEQNFHKDHLACKHCDKKLIACRYILKDENPYCIPCYQELFAHNCYVCRKPVGPDYKDLSYKDKHWHEFCFKCGECQKSLVNQPFAYKDDAIFCSDCHDELFAARCDGCKKPFKGGMKKFEYKNTQWHEECFLCNVCKEAIKNKSFIPRGDEVVCIPCFENKYAQKCAKCNGVLTKGGVAYKDIPWHRECFTCSKCNKNLAGEKFTSREEKPYCADCYGDLFAKKCCICSKAIMGFGGTKFISFEDRHWHSDCFNCNKCKTSMVGKGFLMNEGDILCPPCGRN
ncbi:planar cell polarity 3-A-like isoform X2 [Octopus vulgaris]|uniref:Planar cell polarity 3-A-like isoform X2 n=3 Tax=Octopus TaxID=6643 RepID=A0AA36BQ54_OCTVU|nr:prickle planar cell polarity protein 3-B [Octopus sinensis]CAI9738390.1 planar cell polarity 3-A-like isoform X2 [Octopus vulgaris]